MEEKAYRQSRLCLLLGNPVTFSIVCALTEKGEMRPSKTAEQVGRSMPSVSNIFQAYVSRTWFEPRPLAAGRVTV